MCTTTIQKTAQQLLHNEISKTKRFEIMHYRRQQHICSRVTQNMERISLCMYLCKKNIFLLKRKYCSLVQLKCHGVYLCFIPTRDITEHLWRVGGNAEMRKGRRIQFIYFSLSYYLPIVLYCMFLNYLLRLHKSWTLLTLGTLTIPNFLFCQTRDREKCGMLRHQGSVVVHIFNVHSIQNLFGLNYVRKHIKGLISNLEERPQMSNLHRKFERVTHSQSQKTYEMAQP